MKTMYKVVEKGPLGSLRSCWTPGALAIEYKPNRWTRKLKYGPFVFRQKKDAMNYIDSMGRYGRAGGPLEIWRCDVADDCHSIDYMCDDLKSCSTRLELTQMMTDVQEQGIHHIAADFTWSNTFIASRIRLTQRLV